jgi:hypothetical protein
VILFHGNVKVFWHVDPLLGKDHKISNYTTAVAKQWLSSDRVFAESDTNLTIALQQRNGVFHVVRVEIV